MEANPVRRRTWALQEKSADLKRAAQVAQGGALGEQGVLGVLDGDPFKLDLIPCLQLPQDTKVSSDDGGDLGVSPGGLPVGQHDDRLSGGGDLDGAKGDAVRDNVR